MDKRDSGTKKHGATQWTILHKCTEAAYNCCKRHRQRAKALYRLPPRAWRGWWNLSATRKELVFTAVIALATVVYAVVATKQWHIMRDQLDELRRQQRAYVVIGRNDGVVAEFVDSKEASLGKLLRVYLRNSGQSSASHVNLVPDTIYIRVWHDRPEYPEMIYLKGLEQERRTRMRERSNPGGGVSIRGQGITIGAQSTTREPLMVVDPDSLKLLTNRNNMLIVHGFLEYCTAQGDFSCKAFQLVYREAPLGDSFVIGDEVTCKDEATEKKATPGPSNVDYLPPCEQPNEQW